MVRSPEPEAPCPCGSGEPFGGCCAPVLGDARLATTAEHLMRSRYTAYAVGDEGHLLRTWHPRTRPAEITVDGTEWLGLRILDVRDGQPGDSHGVVEFEATYRDGGREVLRERSEFQWRAGRWMYVGMVEDEAG